MEAEQSRKRRRYSRELKAQILAECEAPGASVAKVATSHGINANRSPASLLADGSATSGDRLQLEPLGSADALLRRRRSAIDDN